MSQPRAIQRITGAIGADGTLAIWGNRITQHDAVADDVPDHRVMPPVAADASA